MRVRAAVPVGDEATNHAIGCIVFAVGQRRDVVAQPFEQHLDVAHLTELAPDPPQLRTQLVRPLLVDEVTERPQVRAHPPGRDARLVHVFGVLAAANGRFVGDEPVDGAARARRSITSATDRRVVELERSRHCFGRVGLSAARPRVPGSARATRGRRPSAPCFHVPSGSSVHARTSSARLSSRISSSRAAQVRLRDAQHRLDAPVEVARHQVGRTDDVLGARIARLPEAADPRVLEVPPDDRAHVDPLRQPGHARPQAADAAHDQIDARARGRRRVELVDHLRVDDRVHLHRDAPVGPRLPADERLQGRAQVRRVRRSGRPYSPCEAVPGEMVEQLAEVGAELRIGRQDPEVLVGGRGLRVVVARADVAVAADAVRAPGARRAGSWRAS